MKTVKIELSPSQYRALTSEKRFVGFIGGYASGKSFLGSTFLVQHHLQNPGTITAFYAPVYRSISDIFFASIEETAELHGCRVEFNYSDPRVELINGADQSLGIIKCRSLSQPQKIHGYQCSAAVCDEVDLVPERVMGQSWLKLIARLRLPVKIGENQVMVCSTPEGFGFCHDKWVRNKTESYDLIQCSTFENIKNLPPDFIHSLEETCTEKTLQAYLHGEFVNLQADTVYYAFERHKNDKTVKVQPGEIIRIGVDFNIGRMAGIACVTRDKYYSYNPNMRAHEAETCFVVDELIGYRDTPDLIREIEHRFPGHPIEIYPDSSGVARHTSDAGKSDFSHLRAAGFAIRAKSRNPQIRDRISSVNYMFCNSKGRRRLFIDVNRCETLIHSLEKQVYHETTRLPDKSSDIDHPVDALGYLVNHRYGLARSHTKIFEIA